MTNLMAGKRGLICGVANEKSIAWAIARNLAQHGAELAFTYQGEALERRVAPLAQSVGSDFLLSCDVTQEHEIDDLFKNLQKRWDKIDFLVHAIAFSDKQELKGQYLQTSRDNFLRPMDISCYSLTAMVQRALPMLNEGASILTMTYYGAERVMPHYNVMGVAKAALEASVRYLAVDLGQKQVRINAISAGPIKTLAASAIGDFRYILRWNEMNAPLRRNVDANEVGQSALYFLSPLSSGVTGEIHHVDSGYHVTGMVFPDAADEASKLLEELSAKNNV
ncbi:MAG: enoyl-ACP reductase FabI [Pseudomonadota bacterium]